MNSNNVYVPSSYSYEPVSFLSQFGPEDQLFQRPLLNTLGQNSRLPPAPPRPPVAQPPTSNYQRIPPQLQQLEEPFGAQQHYLSDEQDAFFTDQQTTNEQSTNNFHHFQDEDSKRQGSSLVLSSLNINMNLIFSAVWNDLQRTNFQKHDSANQYKRNNNRQTSKASPQFPYRPSVGTRVNPMEDNNNDGQRSKENSYQRSPTKRYEDSLVRGKPMDNYPSNDPFESNNQYTNENGASPKTIAIPLSKFFSNYISLSLIEIF